MVWRLSVRASKLLVRGRHGVCGRDGSSTLWFRAAGMGFRAVGRSRLRSQATSWWGRSGGAAMHPGTEGRAFREAWVAGVKRHYPGVPKDSYVAGWDQTPEWERGSAAAVYDQVRAFVIATDGATAKLSRAQKG